MTKMFDDVIIVLCEQLYLDAIESNHDVFVVVIFVVPCDRYKQTDTGFHVPINCSLVSFQIGHLRVNEAVSQKKWKVTTPNNRE